MKSKRSAEPQLQTYQSEPLAQTPAIEQPATLPLPSEITEPELQSRIRELAYQLYVQRGYVDGHDLEDWLEAEFIIRQGGKLAA